MVPKLHEKNRKKAMHPTETEQLLMKWCKSYTFWTLESSENQFIIWRANFPATQIYAKKAHGVAIKKPALPQPQTLCFPLFLRQLHLFRQRANNVVQTPSGVLCTEKHVYICKHHQSQLIECSFWSADHLGSLYGPWWQSFKKKGKTSQLKGE